ncbi:MAG TPA: DUF6298 domain-containing protein [Gemmatimonadaceae bacterium]|nr:DUF6298 domain-containing protein [Gemmatimonadaceae bacterium]
MLRLPFALVLVSCPLVTVAGQSCVPPLWGDVNADTHVDIIDAQQIARYSVGLSVVYPGAVAARGDANSDAAVNIIDAQQLARFTVGLSASARINTRLDAIPTTVALGPGGSQSILVGNTRQFTAIPFDDTNTDVSACETVAWTSTNAASASVSSAGLVSALATGVTTIRATAGNGVASVSVNVGTPGGPLRPSAANSRYFTDNSGSAVYLSGSHTWNDLQDATNFVPFAPFNWQGFLDFLTTNHHNFTQLWTWENTVWPDAGSVYTPMPWARTGPGVANDGQPKFDLTQFNDAYFSRLRQRVIDAGARGIYVSVMLFQGFSIEDRGSGNPWPANPFNAANNVNGINGDPGNDGSGEETQTLQFPAITSLQDAYVHKVVDAVNDLDNVLYEVANESHGSTAALAWQEHVIQVVRQYEAGKSKQHPIGISALYPNGSDADLFASAADFVSPAGSTGVNDTPAQTGAKVVLLDTDHICGVCGDGVWVWKSFLRGANPLFMDVFDGSYGEAGTTNPSDPKWVSARTAMGQTLSYAKRVNLLAMTPRADLSSTGYCLANPASIGAEYLAYAPAGGAITLNLSATMGSLSVEWFFPETGQTVSGGTTTGGGSRTLTPPQGGAAVVYVR